MAYRNGTYVAFHAEGTSDPTETDMKYYRLLTAWHKNDGIDFDMINSHEKTSAVRDTSKRQTLIARLKERLNNSKNMVLIIGETTRLDNDWVPFEIQYAVDSCEIPIIATYPGCDIILEPNKLQPLWPLALKNRIEKKSARVIHVPFKKEPLKAAISKFSHDNLPKGGRSFWTEEVYRDWGLIH